MMGATTFEIGLARLENAIRDGQVSHSVPCDLLFAEAQFYLQERCDEFIDRRDPRECECERRFFRKATP